ncbi:MAG: hypothetical protein HYR66_14500 [Sphingobacteriales bacterium]|nr:hypothetical protein [Sphingobacteriales bacterium]MBI3719307.1 hypothetical protein [Sphingobacteriales bacterium]
MIKTKRILIINLIGLSILFILCLKDLISLLQEDIGARELFAILFGFFLLFFFGGLLLWNYEIYRAAVANNNHSPGHYKRSVFILIIGVVLPSLVVLYALYKTISHS